jgi:hypothetical protein
MDLYKKNYNKKNLHSKKNIILFYLQIIKFIIYNFL